MFEPVAMSLDRARAEMGAPARRPGGFFSVSSDAFAQEKIRTMEAFGAAVEIVPSDGGKVTPALFDRFKARIAEVKDDPGTFWTDQFHNADALNGYRQIGIEWLEQRGASGAAMLVKRDFSSEMPKGITQSGALYYGIPHVRGFDLQVAGFDFDKERFTSVRRSVLKELLTSASDFDWMADSRSLVYVAGRQSSLGLQNVTNGEQREIRTGARRRRTQGDSRRTFSDRSRVG